VLAITGCTGEYAGARGEMALSAIGTEGKAYSFIAESSNGEPGFVGAPRLLSFDLPRRVMRNVHRGIAAFTSKAGSELQANGSLPVIPVSGALCEAL
jgi:hypothetical protein